jgi:hypothetical protein
MKLTGKRSAGNPHATFDEAEAGNVLITLSGAPVFDPTDEGELEIEHSATTPALYSTVRDKSDFRKILYFLLLKTEHSAILPGMRHSDSNPQ